MKLKPETEKRTRRWAEQRWIVDNLIAVQRAAMGAAAPVSTSPRRYSLPAAIEGEIDLQTVSLRVEKFDDIPREYARIARQREELARRAEEAGHLVTARDNYAAAACFYGNAGWAIFEAGNEELHTYYAKKNACYDKVIAYAPFPIERLEVPFGNASLPALLYLPGKVGKGAPAEKFPCVVSINGMDSFKEILHPIYGDKFLARGMAVLAFDGPGQGECLVRGLFVEPDSFRRASRACFDYLLTRPEIDSARIAAKGMSYGSLWVLHVAAAEPRYVAASGTLGCLEPGGFTIFEEASPTFKQRFMFMADIDDEAEFDEFAKTLTWEGYADKVRCPTLMILGAADELSPVQYAYDLYDTLTCPKTLIVYDGARHGITGPQTANTPNHRALEADWLRDRFDGRPLESSRILIDLQGREHAH